MDPVCYAPLSPPFSPPHPFHTLGQGGIHCCTRSLSSLDIVYFHQLLPRALASPPALRAPGADTRTSRTNTKQACNRNPPTPTPKKSSKKGLLFSISAALQPSSLLPLQPAPAWRARQARLSLRTRQNKGGRIGRGVWVGWLWWGEGGEGGVANKRGDCMIRGVRRRE